MRTAASFLAILLVALTTPSTRAAPAASTSGVFLLEVPEFDLKVNENGAAPIANSSVSRLELRVLRSSQEVSPGKILVRINGEAANTVMSTRNVESMIVCDLDLNYRPGFLLHSGRNAIEASAESLYGRVYYAVFLLDVQEPASLREIQREPRVSKLGEKPPLIHLINPQGPVENVRELSVQGYVEGGVAPVTVTIQGEPVKLAAGVAPFGQRGVQLQGAETSHGFVAQIALSRTQTSIEIIATDAHNNRMRYLIPVIQGTRTPSQRWAVVIGVSHYRNTGINLQYADRDAESVRDFLLDPKGGAVPPANLLYLVNDHATSANIRSALFDFLTKPGPDDLAIVYFAGHGMNDRKRPDNYYLLGFDTDLENIGGTAVPMWELEIAFERTLKANVVTFVDACHSGGIGKAVPNMTNARWQKAGFGEHRAIITASEADELSREGPEWGGGHGVFTYYLLQGLKGKADANHDHQVSVGELFDFVRERVVKETAGAQTPAAQARLARGLVMARTSASALGHGVDWNRPVSGGNAP